MIKALHEQIDTLRGQVNQGLTREEDWKKREQRWEVREESWNAERDALLRIIQQERERIVEIEARSDANIASKRERKLEEKAEAILKKAETNLSREEER